MKLTSLLLVFASGINGSSETYDLPHYSPAKAFVAKTWERVDALTSLETRLEDHQDLVGVNTFASWGTSTIGVVLLPIAAPTGAVVWGAGVLGHMFTSMHDCFVSGEASKERREIMLKNGYDRELADFIRVHMQLDMSVEEIRQFYVEDKPSSSSKHDANTKLGLEAELNAKLGKGGLLTKISTKVAESKELSPELADSPNMMQAAVNALTTDATNVINAMEAGKWTQQIALSTQTYAVVASVWLIQS